jgi:hypothetical protein
MMCRADRAKGTHSASFFSVLSKAGRANLLRADENQLDHETTIRPLLAKRTCGAGLTMSAVEGETDINSDRAKVS